MRGGIEILEIAVRPNLRGLVHAAALADNHPFMAQMATHAFVRDGQVVGAAGLCVPLAVFWADSKKLKAISTVPLIRECVEIAGKVSPVHLCECDPDSPLHQFMPKLGYKRLGFADFYQREEK